MDTFLQYIEFRFWTRAIDIGSQRCFDFEADKIKYVPAN